MPYLQPSGTIDQALLKRKFSAPMIAYIRKAASLSGPDMVMAFFSAKGASLLVSVMLGGLIIDSVDKLLTSLIALALLSWAPASLFPQPASQDSA